MHIYLTKIPAKFHPDSIWNEGALGFFWMVLPQQQQQDEQQYGISSLSKKITKLQ